MKKLCILLLFVPALGWAQEQKKNNWGWRSYVATGIIAGDIGTNALVQLSGGITYKRFFAGVGAGYDPYQIEAIPLFLDLKMDFLKTRSAFVYFNIGQSLPWDNTVETETFKVKDNVNAGLYLDLGLGYRIPLGGAHNLAFSAGYGRKQMEWEKVYEYPCGIQPCYNQPVYTYVYDYKFGRIIVKLAWEFGSGGTKSSKN